MACCFSMPNFEEEEPLVVDVNKMISDKAWNNFKYSFGFFKRKCIKRKNFTIEVPENYFVFTQISQKITDPGRGIKMSPSEELKNRGDMLENKLPASRPSNPEAISLDTLFSNDTAQMQTYQFKFSKKRSTSVEVSFQKGFTVGGKASFSVGAPKVLGGGELGLEAEMQYEVSKSEGQSFTEEMNIEATSDISVGPKSSYVANVQLEERSVHVAFQIRTRMSLPQAKAPIYIKRKSDDKLVWVYQITNLKDIFAGEVMCQKVEGPDGKVMKEAIDFIIDGHMKGSLACDHRINLTSDETEQEKHMGKMKHLHAGEDD